MFWMTLPFRSRLRNFRPVFASKQLLDISTSKLYAESNIETIINLTSKDLTS